MRHLLFGLLFFQTAACDSYAPLPPMPVPPVPVVDAGPIPSPGPVPTPGPSPSPTPAPPAPVLVADAGPAPHPEFAPGVVEACANLATLGCAEGRSSCASSLQSAVIKRLTNVQLGCLTVAPSKAAVRACGSFVACH